MGIDEMNQLGDWIARTVAAVDDDQALAKIADAVAELCATFPAPGL